MARRRPPLAGLSKKDLADAAGMSVSDLRALSEQPKAAYVRRTLQREGRRPRTLHVPRRRLRRIQRALLRRTYSKVPAHECSACVRDKGTHWAYERHVRGPGLLRLDLKRFFPSVRQEVVLAAHRDYGAGAGVAELLTGLVSLPSGLPQGAPTSVAVADLVLADMDRRLAGLASSEGLTYTRYVDDVAFSGGTGKLSKLEGTVRRIIEDCGWTLHPGKGGVTPPGERQEFLGAVVNFKPNASRSRYEEVRVCLHQILRSHELPEDNELDSLLGLAEWVMSLNPVRRKKLYPLVSKVRQMRNGEASHEQVS